MLRERRYEKWDEAAGEKFLQDRDIGKSPLSFRQECGATWDIGRSAVETLQPHPAWADI
jgi:hypothetical protein